MKKVVLIIVMAFYCLYGFSQQAITISSVNFRKEASPTATKITTIPKGAVLAIIDSADGWYVAKYRGITGFVNAALVRVKETNIINEDKQNEQSIATTNNGNHVKHYTNIDGERVQSPTKYDAAPEGATAVCRDGSYSFSRNHRGTCSHHGGVARWLQ